MKQQAVPCAIAAAAETPIEPSGLAEIDHINVYQKSHAGFSH
jgi:hypothetical protein